MIGLIGAGKVGSSLARFFYEYYVHKGINLLALSSIYSKHVTSANETISLLKKISCNQATACIPKVANSIAELVKNSDFIFITVPDSVISFVDEELYLLGKEALKDKLLVHCSGVLSAISAFKKSSELTDTVSLHPILAFNSKETSIDSIQKAFFTLEGSNTGIQKIKFLLNETGIQHTVLSSDASPDDLKAKYHLASVLVSNCVVGLFSMGQDLLCECGFSKDDALKALTPLFINNANNIIAQGVTHALTGPVLRNDAITLKKHMNCLNDNDIDLYRLLSQKLYKISKNINPQKDYNEIKNLLFSEDKNK